MPCNPCALPTAKTPVAIAPAEPLKATEPEPIMMRGNLLATLAEPVAKPAAAASPTPLTVPVQRPVKAMQPEPEAGHVLFASASAKLDADALAYIKRFAVTAKGAAGIQVTGQTDSTGTAAGNERLALARARIVRAALIAAGIPASKIKTTTCLTCFAGDNSTEDGKRQNRRAEIAITKGHCHAALATPAGRRSLRARAVHLPARLHGPGVARNAPGRGIRLLLVAQLLGGCPALPDPGAPGRFHAGYWSRFAAGIALDGGRTCAPRNGGMEGCKATSNQHHERMNDYER